MLDVGGDGSGDDDGDGYDEGGSEVDVVNLTKYLLH